MCPELYSFTQDSTEKISVVVLPDDASKTEGYESCSKYEGQTHDEFTRFQESSKSTTSKFEVTNLDTYFDKNKENEDDESDDPSPVDQCEVCLNGPLVLLDEMSKLKLFDLKGPIVPAVENIKEEKNIALNDTSDINIVADHE